MKKETAIVALVIVAVASFLLGRFTAGKTEIVATATDATAKGVGAPGAPGAPGGDLYRVPVGSSPWKGAQVARVTIVEVSEFECPFCSRVQPTLQRILHEYAGKVKIVFKHNPLSFHQNAQLASEAALAAHEQGKFWEYHDRLFNNQKALGRADLERYAQDLGLDLGRFKAALEAGKFKGAILEDQRLARQVGADGTPAFFINGRLLSGAQPFEEFKKVIDQEMQRADAALARGVALANLYDELTKDGLAAKKAAPPPAGAPQDESRQVYRVPLDESPAKGPATAKVTIVEFSEFQCPFCSRVLPTLKELEGLFPGQIRVVFKHNPLPFHKEAPLASEAALAAHDQGRFWDFHDKLFANHQALGRADLERYAQELGLDLAAFKASLDTNKHKAQIDRDMAQARQFGAFGTPTFFINGRKIAGAQPLDNFKKIVEEEIQKADAVLARGVAATAIYAELTRSGLDKAAPPPPPPQRPADDSKTVYKVPVGKDDACKGAKNALVTVVEFSEFQCPFCSRVGPALEEILNTYAGKLRVCFKHSPLPFHKDAVPASIVALEAHKQGKFWKLHDLLFKNQKALGRADLERYAAEAGLNLARVKAALDEGRYKKVIDEHQKIAADLGARGTPSFFINGRKLVGAQPVAAFKTLIDEELRKAEDLVAKGTPRSRIYEEVTKGGLTKMAAAPAAPGRPGDDAKTVYKVPVPKHAPCKGPATAQVTIVEISEFQCPFCSRVLPTFKELGDKYAGKLRVCFLHNPLPFHKEAPGASKAAMAAQRQGKFWEYHDKLFANQRALTPADLERYAVEVGLEMDRFKADLGRDDFQTALKADQDLAAKLGARGTPTFFINGRKLVGAQPAPAFQAMIDEEIQKTDALLKKGISRRKLYEEIIKGGVESAAAAPSPAQRPDEDDKVYDVPVGDAPVKGPAGARVTILVFSDFQCPFCSRVNPTLRQLEQEFPGKIRIAWKHSPLPFHQEAPLAHQASIEAQAQGKFWEYHDKLFANQQALKRDDLERYAQELGLDMERFKSSLDSGRHKARIDSDMAAAGKAGIRGTPSFLINGRKLVGAQPYERFKEKVQAALGGR